MALIKCQECGKEFSDKASACPNCACTVEKETRKVIIERAKGALGSKTPVIYIDDIVIGNLPLGKTLEVDIPIGKHKFIMEYYVDDTIGVRTGALATKKSIDDFTIDEDTDFIKIDISKFLVVKISNGNNCACTNDNTTIENNVKEEKRFEDTIYNSSNTNSGLKNIMNISIIVVPIILGVINSIIGNIMVRVGIRTMIIAGIGISPSLIISAIITIFAYNKFLSKYL